jgi:replicative DNA helicase
MTSLAHGTVDRIPPSNLEAEMALLGSILVDREMMPTVSEIVGPTDFYAHVHETIFLALVQLYERGEPLDKITLAEELQGRSLLDKVGGLPYLTSLMDTVPTAASAEYYARIVQEKSALRGLIHAGTQITQIGFESEEDVDGAIDKAEQVVYEVGRRQMHGDFAPIRKLLKGTFEQIDRLYHSRGDRTGLTSGFRDIDEYTSGFQPGNFVILAARPAMGKTSMALTMAAAAAKEEQKPIAIFSLEMTNEELVTRLLCGEARINSLNLRRGNIKDSEWEKISSGMSALSEMPIYIDDSGTVTVSEIRSRCRRLKSGDGLAAVFIDYLQLVRPSGATRSQNRNDELSEICRTLKATAKDLQIPIIALAQLNRGVESRNDKRPMLSDLRDCLTGDSLIANADTGERVALSDIVERRMRFNVWAMDANFNLVKRPIVDSWAVGVKPVFRVTTKSGRTIRCTDGHRFRTVAGWKKLSELNIDGVVAVVSQNVAAQLTRARVSAPLRGVVVTHGSAAATSFVQVTTDVSLESLTFSDVLWDPIASIVPDGDESVYDITVGDLHNFCVDDFVTHNSGAIEQEADMVTFLYREAYYNPEGAPEPDLTEFIIAKSRNGPTGTVKLRFLKEHTLFVPYADAGHYSPP